VRAYTAPPMHPSHPRTELDDIAGHYSLDSAGVDTLLEVAQARPGADATRQFLARMLRIGGVLSLAAAVVFFIAANWSKLEVFGRFGLLELLLVACAVVALARPPPSNFGRAALFLAFVTTGALLALFGQTYQTGADVYELFLTWALLGLPIAILANWSVSSAGWLLVLNTSLALYFGWTPAGGLFWMLFAGWHFNPANFLLAATWLNVLLWFAFEHLDLGAVPQWVRRLAIFCGFAFGTWVGILGVVDHHVSGLVVPGLAVAMALTALHAWRRRTDIFPIAMVMATFIIVGLVWVADITNFKEEGLFLLLAVWLIGTSTFAARMLADTVRRWREEGAT
jgi:uncharacterized membrane protein